MILPVDDRDEYVQTLIGLAMLSRARGYGVEGSILDIAEYVRLELGEE